MTVKKLIRCFDRNFLAKKYVKAYEGRIKITAGMFSLVPQISQINKLTFARIPVSTLEYTKMAPTHTVKTPTSIKIIIIPARRCTALFLSLSENSAPARKRSQKIQTHIDKNKANDIPCALFIKPSNININISTKLRIPARA